MRELNLDRLRTLVTIADLGSFAAAARSLHLAPPTVSLHIAELEARLGAALLVRQRGPVVPTGVGATLIERARRLLALADDTHDVVQRQIQGKAARVRIGASTGAIAHLLPQALAALAREHPGIEVDVAVLTSEETLAGLTGARLDIGLVALPQVPIAGVRVAPWRRDPVMAFLPSSWSAPKVATPLWLAGQPLILNDAGTRLSRLTSAWFAKAGLAPRARIELNFNDAIRSLVAAGYGAALLPHEATGLVADPRITMRALRPALWRALGIAHRSDKPEAATRLVLDVLARFRQT